MSDKPVVSLSGAPVRTYPNREKSFEPAHGDADLITAISDHIHRYVGPVTMVYHEIISDLVHIDIHHVAPTKDLPYHFLITSGMSERPMAAPSQAEQCRFAELFIALPSSWPMDQQSWRKPEWYWPIRQLKVHARFPHAVDSWLWYGHTIQNSDGEPYDKSVRFNSLALGPSSFLDPAFAFMQVLPKREVAFFALHFLFAEELQFKMRAGAHALFDRFEKRRITELVNPKRKNVCREWWAPPWRRV